MSHPPRPPGHREVGTVLSVTPTGTLTVRSGTREATAEGTIVTDRRTPFRGRVVRVFGPVDRPYLVIRPRRALSAEDGLALLGAALWTVPSDGRGP